MEKKQLETYKDANGHLKCMIDGVEWDVMEHKESKPLNWVEKKDEHPRITSLYELKKWNINPTKEIPIVLEWYMDWMFDVCLLFKNYDMFKDAVKAMDTFTMICEKMEIYQARHRTEENLRFWWKRASKPIEPFRHYFNMLILERYGV